jgi:hypothetical protein
LRRKAADHFAKTQTPGCHDAHGAAGSLPDSSAGGFQAERPAGSRSELCPGAAVDGDPSRDGKPPAAPFIPATNGKTMQVTDPHAQLKADALRTATNGILARLYPQKPIKPEKENTK